MNTEETFEHFFVNNSWGCPETKSGYGSTVSSTFFHKYQFSVLFQLLNIKSVCDAPCGDCNWIFQCLPPNIEYVGVDISKTAVNQNGSKFPDRKFIHADISKDVLPEVDLILCRDCLGHLPHELSISVLRNFKASKSRYLLTTTFIGDNPEWNANVSVGGWTAVKLQATPFNLPQPLCFLNEEIDMKKLGLWKLDDIKI